MINQILIRNARSFDAADDTFSAPCDIRVENGRGAEISQNIAVKPGYEVLEGENLCVSTGWTDCHTHFGGLDPFLTYPGLGVTRVHEAGSFGAFTFERFHQINSRLPFPATAYLYVGCWGVANGELRTLDNLKEEPFLETARAFPDEILGAKIRIDPRVNCDTKKSLRMAKELAVKAELPLVVHPSRCTDSIEEILAVMDKDDVYAHTYSPVSPSIFDEHGKVKKAIWDAVERGVRFDLSHGSNNFGYDIARRAIQQGFAVETISTDLHLGNYTKPGIRLAGVVTKAIQAGIPLADALKKVILTPAALLHVPTKVSSVQVGQAADITVFTISQKDIELPDVVGKVETCKTVIQDVATVIGSSLNRSFKTAILCENYAAD